MLQQLDQIGIGGSHDIIREHVTNTLTQQMHTLTHTPHTTHTHTHTHTHSNMHGLCDRLEHDGDEMI